MLLFRTLSLQIHSAVLKTTSFTCMWLPQEAQKSNAEQENNNNLCGTFISCLSLISSVVESTEKSNSSLDPVELFFTGGHLHCYHVVGRVASCRQCAFTRSTKDKNMRCGNLWFMLCFKQTSSKHITLVCNGLPIRHIIYVRAKRVNTSLGSVSWLITCTADLRPWLYS